MLKSLKRAIDDIHRGKYEFNTDLKDVELTPSEEERRIVLLYRNHDEFATYDYDV